MPYSEKQIAERPATLRELIAEISQPLWRAAANSRLDELEAKFAAAAAVPSGTFRRVLQPFADYGAACQGQSPEDSIATIKQKTDDGPLEVVATILVRDCLVARDILAIGKKP